MTEIVFDWHSLTDWAFVGLFAASLSYLACRAAMNIAVRRGMLVKPGIRQSHAFVTPTGGGLGLVVSVLVTSLLLQFFPSLPAFWWAKVLPGVVALAVVGWLDDKQHVSALIRLLIQLVVSLYLLGSACFQNSADGLVVCLGLIFLLVWVMNLYNFMDGSNGMAGFQGIFTGLVLAVLFFKAGQIEVALVSLVVVAACAGFLPLNFPQAKVFMGDVASVPLGFMFAALAIYGWQTDAIALASLILVLSVFVVDTSLTLLRRVIHGERWYTAHNQHVFQQLIAYGWSHSRVLVAYQVINMILVLPGIVLTELYPQYAGVITGFVIAVLGMCWQMTNLNLGKSATAGQLK